MLHGLFQKTTNVLSMDFSNHINYNLIYITTIFLFTHLIWFVSVNNANNLHLLHLIYMIFNILDSFEYLFALASNTQTHKPHIHIFWMLFLKVSFQLKTYQVAILHIVDFTHTYHNNTYTSINSLVYHICIH